MSLTADQVRELRDRYGPDPADRPGAPQEDPHIVYPGDTVANWEGWPA